MGSFGPNSPLHVIEQFSAVFEMALHFQEQGFARMVAGLFLLNKGHEVHHRRFHQRIPWYILLAWATSSSAKTASLLMT